MKVNYRLVFISILVFILTFGLGILTAKFFNLGLAQETLEEKAAKGKMVSILIMGLDARNGTENSRSDTMILVNVDRQSKKIAMVWIPRDTRVEVGFNRYDRINSINSLKGPEAACDVVGKLLNTKVNYYITLNFSGFAKIVDILGGVLVDVEADMRHFDPDPKLNINLTKGEQILNGKEALDYVRYRERLTADIGRTARQQKFIKALAQETLKAKNIIKLPKILPEIFEQVKTNIPTNDVLFMINVAREFDEASVITQTLPGYPFTDPKTGASYWGADEKIAKTIIDDLFTGKTYDVAQDPPNWVKPAPSIYEAEEVEEEVSENEENKPEDNDEIEEIDDGNSGLTDNIPNTEAETETESETKIDKSEPPALPEGDDLVIDNTSGEGYI